MAGGALSGKRLRSHVAAAKAAASFKGLTGAGTCWPTSGDSNGIPIGKSPQQLWKRSNKNIQKLWPKKRPVDPVLHVCTVSPGLVHRISISSPVFSRSRSLGVAGIHDHGALDDTWVSMWHPLRAVTLGWFGPILLRGAVVDRKWVEPS